MLAPVRSRTLSYGLKSERDSGGHEFTLRWAETVDYELRVKANETERRCKPESLFPSTFEHYR